MYKLVLVLVALFACVFAAQDQEAAEQYFLRYGSYPSWYNYAGLRTYAAAPVAYAAGYTPAATAYAAPAYAAYPYMGYAGYGYNYVY